MASHRPDGSDGLDEANPWGLTVSRPTDGFDSVGMGCEGGRRFPIAGSPRERTGGKRRGKPYNHGVGRPAEGTGPRSTGS